MAPSTHSADVSQIQADTTAILVDTGTTIPATIATVDGNVDSILVDTGTTIPATIATVDGNVDSILVDTGTTIPATIATVDGNVDSILVDTGTTIPGRLDTVDTNVATVDTVVDGIAVETADLADYVDNVRYLVASGSYSSNVTTTSSSWVSTGSTITMPTNVGATYTVVVMVLGIKQETLTDTGYMQIHGDSLGNQTFGSAMQPAVATQQIDKSPFGRGGFGSAEVATVQMTTNSGKSIYTQGEITWQVFQETAT